METERWPRGGRRGGETGPQELDGEQKFNVSSPDVSESETQMSRFGNWGGEFGGSGRMYVRRHL